MLRKRPDNFHEIASLYQAVDLGDYLTISVSNEDLLTCTDPTIPVDEKNLVLRALALFRKKTGISRQFRFSLDKRIPMEAGLGGGSSNAATTLWGLNQLTAMGISNETLSIWAAEIGSDVAFFFSNGRAYCEGKGEMLTAQPPSYQRLWIAKPENGLSTPEVYGALELDQLEKRNPKQALLSHQSNTPLFFNDLEAAAFALMPELQKIKNALKELGFTDVHMTGSGTAFFCFGDVVDPKLPNATFYPACFLQRSDESWYKFPA